MLRQFVWWTGAFDFVIGIGIWASAMSDPLAGQFVPLMSLGAYLMMAAALLIWASGDMYHRAPVMVWQGMVRLIAMCSILFAVPYGLAEQWLYSIVIADAVVGLVYIFGARHVTGMSIARLVLCDDPNSGPEEVSEEMLRKLDEGDKKLD
jgi:hypothetical protein